VGAGFLFFKGNEMANRNFKPGAMAIEKGLICLYGRVVFGAAGAIASQDCRGFSVTKGATGEIDVLLEDEYTELYSVTAIIQGASAKDSFLTGVDVQSSTPGFTLDLVTDPASADKVLIEITLKNSTVKF